MIICNSTENANIGGKLWKMQEDWEMWEDTGKEGKALGDRYTIVMKSLEGFMVSF